MKKKYCAPVIKAVLFKAEEAVSACVVDLFGNVRADHVTPEDDGDNWATFNYEIVWWRRFSPRYDYFPTVYLVSDTTNAS